MIVDGGGIQDVGSFFEFDAGVFIGVKGACSRNQDLTEVGVHPPVPLFVRPGKGATRYSASDAEMIEFLPAGTEGRPQYPEGSPGRLAARRTCINTDPYKRSCLYGNCRCTGQCICEIHTSAHSP